MHSKAILLVALAAAASAQEITLPVEKPTAIPDVPTVSGSSGAASKPFTIQTSTGPLHNSGSTAVPTGSVPESSGEVPEPTGSTGAPVESPVPSSGGEAPPAESTAPSAPAGTTGVAEPSGSGAGTGTGTGPAASASVTGSSGTKNGVAAFGVALAAGLAAFGIVGL